MKSRCSGQSRILAPALIGSASLPIANDREAACKPAKSGAPCGSEGTMRRQGLDGDTASASVDHRSVDRKAELRSLSQASCSFIIHHKAGGTRDLTPLHFCRDCNRPRATRRGACMGRYRVACGNRQNVRVARRPSTRGRISGWASHNWRTIPRNNGLAQVHMCWRLLEVHPMVPFGRTRYQLQVCGGCAVASGCGKPEASSCAPVMYRCAFHWVRRIGAGAYCFLHP